MDPKLKNTLSSVFLRSLETQAFMFGDPVERGDFDDSIGKSVSFQIAYEGSKSGNIMMTVPDERCGEFAANIIGLEPGLELERDKTLDALKEILNITCGNFITDYFGYDAEIYPTIPETRENQNGWMNMCTGDNVMLYLVDEIPVILTISED